MLRPPFIVLCEVFYFVRFAVEARTTNSGCRSVLLSATPCSMEFKEK